MKKEEYILEFKELNKRYHDIVSKIDANHIKECKTKLNLKTSKENFWENQSKAKLILKEISILDNDLEEYNSLISSFNEINDNIELLNLGEPLDEDSIKSLHSFSEILERYEIKKMLNNENDHLGAILTIHPGAGGTESQDWAKMLFRMYSRWCEKNNLPYKLIDYQDGEEGGLKEATIEIESPYSYGLLLSESGVHRLIRISPFDSNSRRHTSFAAIFIYPIIDENINIDIKDSEIRIDTYRASGAGGQHVNKTDSAVRITHIKSGIVVQCQNQRSQLKNKQTAIKLLKSKLFQVQLDEKKSNLDNLSVSKKSIEWGSQIRSYIFHPYNLVKDHRTNYETSNISLVMDGRIDKFIRSYLLNKME